MIMSIKSHIERTLEELRENRAMELEEMIQLSCSLVASGAFNRSTTNHLQHETLMLMADDDKLSFEDARGRMSKEAVQECVRQAARDVATSARFLRTAIMDELDTEGA
jgi:hypothetical protein